MFARVTIRVTDVAASARSYDSVLATPGVERAGDAPTERFGHVAEIV
jgi:hypothetical protein